MKRYELVVETRGNLNVDVKMVEDCHGEYVKYTDHEKEIQIWHDYAKVKFNEIVGLHNQLGEARSALAKISKTLAEIKQAIEV